MTSFNSTIRDRINGSDDQYPIKYYYYIDDYRVFLHRYIYTSIALIVFVFNVLTLATFWKKRLQSPAHIFFSCIAVFDLLYVTTRAIINIFVFTAGDYRDYIPYSICELYMFMFSYLPDLFHSISNWLTVGLAIQRYICITFPFQAKRICSPNYTAVFILTTSMCITTYLIGVVKTFTYSGVTVDSCYIENKTIDACTMSTNRGATLLRVYCSPVISVIIPCVILVGVEPAILNNLRKSDQLRATGARGTLGNISVITIWIVLIFIVSETPFLIHIVSLFLCTEVNIGCSILYSPFSEFARLARGIGCFLNFVIYLSMSKEFRRNFCAIVKQRTSKNVHTVSHHTSETIT